MLQVDLVRGLTEEPLKGTIDGNTGLVFETKEYYANVAALVTVIDLAEAVVEGDNDSALLFGHCHDLLIRHGAEPKSDERDDLQPKCGTNMVRRLGRKISVEQVNGHD